MSMYVSCDNDRFTGRMGVVTHIGPNRFPILSRSDPASLEGLNRHNNPQCVDCCGVGRSPGANRVSLYASRDRLSLGSLPSGFAAAASSTRRGGLRTRGRGGLDGGRCHRVSNLVLESGGLCARALEFSNRPHRRSLSSPRCAPACGRPWLRIVDRRSGLRLSRRRLDEPLDCRHRCDVATE
jgi:hypothetical protein